jgi:hypothetical protein
MKIDDSKTTTRLAPPAQEASRALRQACNSRACLKLTKRSLEARDGRFFDFLTTYYGL